MTRTTATANYQYEFSYHVESYATRIDEEPLSLSELAEPTVPLTIFTHDSTLRSLVRYLRDVRRLSNSRVALALGRTPQCVAATYAHAKPLLTIDETSLRIPVRIFCTKLAPLEALVTHLRELGLRNSEIARLLALDPRTTWTVAKRAEVKA